MRLSFPSFGDNGVLYWLEGRPHEQGRNALVRRTRDGRIEDVVPVPWNVRARVHEYGGMPYVEVPEPGGAAVVFVNFADQRLYVARAPGEAPTPLTAAGGWRFAELTWDARRNRLLAVGERHDAASGAVENAVVAISWTSGDIETLVSGYDFFAFPRLDANGDHLAFVAWNQPWMPWDAAALFVCALTADGRCGPPRHIAGDERGSVFQPAWAADGSLVFAWEADGFWNLHRFRAGEPLERLQRDRAEIGLPLWVLGMSMWGFVGQAEAAADTAAPEGEVILAAALREGRAQLLRIARGDTPKTVALPFSSISHLIARGRRALLLVASPLEGSQLVIYEDVRGTHEVVRAANAGAVDPLWASRPEPVAFPTSEGETAYGFFYPPRNPEFVPLEDERPPLLVVAHGGPTAATTPTYNPAVQYWTSRGFAVLDVNYRGSTGYGRSYRDRLRGQWGVFDVDDCCAGAEHLAAQGRVDGGRLAIRGSSAGGYTTLAALAFRKVFAAGASHYGVSDLEALARDTHKFEARYLDQLIGPYPEKRELYQARSPLHHAEELSCPVIFLQGLEDKVVPPNQAETMVAALRRKGLPVAYLTFEGEQHGFRRAESITRAIEGELAFYGRIFGFTPADPVAPLSIDNLP